MENIAIKGRITKDTFDTIQTLFKNLKDEQYFLHILSRGGESRYAEDIAAMLLSRGTQFIGFGHTQVASSALIIHQACSGDRIATPGTIFQVHRIIPKVGEILTEQHKAAERSTFEFFTKTTGQSLEKIYELADAKKPLTTQEALQLGFITKIIEHPFPNGKGVFFMYICIIHVWSFHRSFLKMKMYWL